MANPVEAARVAADAGPAKAATRYEDDLYIWVEEQVALLRAGRFDELDAENVAEELADVGRAQYDKLESALRVILVHMLKWDHQPERRSRSWDNSIHEHRERVGVVLRKNPGLRSHRSEALSDAYRQARGAASTETDLDRETFSRECPYGWDEVMTREFRWTAPDHQRR